ncbi:ankyrin repeat-containing domain protein [Flagelloscypha sp. PMI_526]|nr:ankyrin repeat-containing domain protein [Flagelloscypha sp. PMI_526]
MSPAATGLLSLKIMSYSEQVCIPADPDIAGIGVRTAIYVQSLLSFIPALYAISDKIVTHEELKSVQTHMATILPTAFAILISAYVQIWRGRLTNYHTVIILSLSWMNNTNACIHALLKIQQEGRYFRTGSLIDHIQHLFRTAKAAKFRGSDYTMLAMGSLHLTLMASLGLYLWIKPSNFGAPYSEHCTMNAQISVLGPIGVPFHSPALRVASILLYAAVLAPGANLALPICITIWLYATYNKKKIQPSPLPVAVCMVVLVVINCILLANIELTRSHNKDIQKPGESEWTYGQTLALLLLFPLLREVARSIWKGIKLDLKLRHIKNKDAAFAATLISEDLDLLGALTPHQGIRVNQTGTYVYLSCHLNRELVSGGRFYTALQLAAYNGRLDIVKLLLEHGANVNMAGGMNGTALQAAAYRGFSEMVTFLLDLGAERDIKGGEYGYALQAAAHAGHVTTLQNLLHYPETFKGTPEAKKLVNLSGPKGTSLEVAAEHGELQIVKILLSCGANHGDALHIAAVRNFVEILKVLVDNKPSTLKELSRKYPWTLLHSASMSGHVEVVKLLVEKGVSINVQSKKFSHHFKLLALKVIWLLSSISLRTTLLTKMYLMLFVLL